MLGAFQLNLTALSLISLLVGMFLIYNTVATAVVRRRHEIGVLRALGLSGLAGAGASSWPRRSCSASPARLLGLVLGVVLAGQLVGAVSQTITSLYILASIQNLFVSPLGHRRRARALPRRGAARRVVSRARSGRALRRSRRSASAISRKQSARSTGRWFAIGIGLLVLAALVAHISLTYGPAWLSFGAALFTLLGFAFFVPTLSVLFSRWIKPRSDHGANRLRPLRAIAASHLDGHRVARRRARHGRRHLDHDLQLSHHGGGMADRSVQADLAIGPAANLVLGNSEMVRPEVEQIIAATPARHTTIPTANCACSSTASRSSSSPRGWRSRATSSGSRSRRAIRTHAFDAAINHGDVLVSQPFFRRFHLGLGDTINLATPTGRRDFKIAGVYIDYTTEGGVILVDWQTYRKFWQDDAINGIGVYIDKNSGVTAAQLQRELRPKIAPYGDYLIKSNQELREQVFRIFDQTFSVTYILQTIGIIISALGIFLSLTILVTERRREISILRAVGASRGQIEAHGPLGSGHHRPARLVPRHRRGTRPRVDAQLRHQRLLLRLDHHLGDALALPAQRCPSPSSPPRSSPAMGPRARPRGSTSPTA